MFREWVLVYFDFIIGVTRLCNINLNITLINKVLDIDLKFHTLTCVMTIDMMVVIVIILIIPSGLRLVGIKRACH